MADLAGDDVTHLALEASSHGLEQRRLDGVRLRGRRLHQSLARSPRLPPHARRLPEGQAPPVRHAASEGGGGGHRCRPAARRKIRAADREGRASSNYVSVGRHGETLKLVSVTRMHDGARLLVEAFGEKRYVALPLVGEFQISNALVAAGLAIATGVDALKALDALADLKGASGRLELVGAHPSGAQVFVDYAHTPDALANALKALRPHAEGKLVVVFGAGGDRDPGKRPLMGAGGGRECRPADRDGRQSAQRRAPPRSAARSSAERPSAEEIGDRRAAIRSSRSSRLQAGRHPAHRRQGPRDRPDRRRQGAAFLRSGRGARRR